MYKNVRDELPNALKYLFRMNYDIHNYYTRRSTGPHLFMRKTTIYCNSFLMESPKLWLKLPTQVKDSPNLNFFFFYKIMNYK